MSDLIKSACPFCGSKDIRFTGYPGMYQNSHCECKDCHTIGPAVFVDDEKAATEAWNRRTQPEATAPAQDLSAAIDKDAKIAAQRARIIELEEQLARALETPVNDWCPECHARESSGDAGPTDAELLDFVAAHPEMTLRHHKRRWSFVGFTNYEYDAFKTPREAIAAAILQSQKGDHAE